MLGRQPLERTRHLRVELEGVRSAAEGLRGRARPVGRQFERRQLAAQLSAPVVPEPFAFGSFEDAALPPHVVCERAGRRRGRQHRVGTQERAELVPQQRQRPVVGRDVVDDEEQNVLVVRAREKPDAERPAFVEPEGLVRPPGQILFKLRLSPRLSVYRLEVDLRERVHALDGLALGGRERRAQHRVSRGQRLERAAQTLRLHLAVQAHGAREVVGGALGRDLLYEPQRVLAEGERELFVRLGDVRLAARRVGGRARGGRRAHLRSECETLRPSRRSAIGTSTDSSAPMACASSTAPSESSP